FWEDAHECAERCREVVGRPARGSAIARSGQERCIANGHLNERVMAQILDWLGGGLRPPSETSPREQIAPAEPALERAAIGRSRPGHRAIASAARSRGANAQPARDVDRAADRFTNSRWAADGRTPRPWRPVGDLRHA